MIVLYHRVSVVNNYDSRRKVLIRVFMKKGDYPDSRGGCQILRQHSVGSSEG